MKLEFHFHAKQIKMAKYTDVKFKTCGQVLGCNPNEVFMECIHKYTAR